MSASERYIPLELVDQIISSIPKRHTKTLSACALVCRSWNSLVRPYLFHTCKVRLDGEQRTARHFSAFLSRARWVSICVRNLTLYGAHEGRDGSSMPPISSGSLALALAYLPALEVLALKRLRISHDGVACTHTCSLRMLSLEGLFCSRMPHPGDLIEILSLFRSVHWLRIHSSTLIANTGEESFGHVANGEEGHLSPDVLVMLRLQAELPLLQVGRLTIDRQDLTSLLLRLIRSSGSVRSLKDVFVHCNSTSDLARVGDLVGDVGSGLRSLTVQVLWLRAPLGSYNIGSPLEDTMTTFGRSIANCTNLESFVLFQWMDDHDPVTASRWIVTMINTLPNSLSYLRIDLDSSCNEGWRAFGEGETLWENLRSAFRRFEGLKVLRLTADGIEGDGSMHEDRRAEILKEMEEFEVTGILRLS
ncbi:hypothetical protein BC835DRAFT_1422674 [Cytidiella melzeri]|nr:hypothetical protein BC835DRAFT_1422674 [Cytidiella melzeri]